MINKNRVVKSISVYVPGNLCNIRCSYCYVSECLRAGHEEKAVFCYPVDHMVQAFDPERLGGIAYITVIGGGETLIPEEVIPFVKGLLHWGHVVEVVTNGTLNRRIDELLADTPKEDLKRLIVKCSLHWLELKRLDRVEDYFNNIRKVVAAGASSYPFLVICQEYMEVLDEILDTCKRELGVLPQCTPCVTAETKEDFLGGSEAVTDPPCTPELVEMINTKIKSPLFQESVRFLDIDPKKIFCYAGKWGFVVEMGTGTVLKCHNVGTDVNFFENITKPIVLEPVGCECGIASCSLQYGLFGLGLIPEVENVPTYAELVCDREGLFQEEVKQLMNTRISDIEYVMTEEEERHFLMDKITEKKETIEEQGRLIALQRRLIEQNENEQNKNEQEAERKIIEMVLQKVETGQITYEDMESVTYRHLQAIMEICDTMEGGDRLYQSVLEKIVGGLLASHTYIEPEVVYHITAHDIKKGILKMSANAMIAEYKNADKVQKYILEGNSKGLAEILCEQLRDLQDEYRIMQRSKRKHFWEHILTKQILEIEERYFGRTPLVADLYEELKKKFENKIVIPFADFSVTTACTLKCRYCSQWVPYLKDKCTYSLKEIEKWLEDIFRYVDYIHIISPLGGEPFLNPEFGKILKLLLEYQKKGRIGFIRLVTNGTIFPEKELQEVLCNPNILIFVSDYAGGETSDEQKDTYARFIEFLQTNKCNYSSFKMDWTDIGTPKERRALTDERRKEVFETCFARDCAGIYNGNLYHCPRSYALENMGWAEPEEREVIRFREITSREDMKRKLEDFYGLEWLSACEYCSLPEERRNIPAAEQL